MDFIDLVIEAEKLVEKHPEEFEIWDAGGTKWKDAESRGWGRAWNVWTAASEWWLAAHERDPKDVRSMTGISEFGRQLVVHCGNLGLSMIRDRVDAASRDQLDGQLLLYLHYGRAHFLPSLVPVASYHPRR